MDITRLPNELINEFFRCSSLFTSSTPNALVFRRTLRTMSTPTLAVFKLPTIKNEANVHYKNGSPERVALEAELARMSAAETVYVPALIGGKEVPHAGAINSQPMPHDHQKNLCTFPTTTPAMVTEAIESALAVKSEWEAMPFNDRAAIFLKVRSFFSPPLFAPSSFVSYC